MVVDYMMEMGLSMSKKIIETMSFNGDVADFLSAIGPFYEFVTPLPQHKVNPPPGQDLVSQAIDSIIENRSSGHSDSASSSSSELSPEKVRMLRGVQEV